MDGIQDVGLCFCCSVIGLFGGFLVSLGMTNGGLVPAGRIIQQHGLVHHFVARGFPDLVWGIRIQEVRSVNQIRDEVLPKGLRP